MDTNVDKLIHSKDTKRQVFIFALGMLVLLWRVVLPQNVEITVGTVILVMVLDLLLMTTVVFLSRKELKEVFAKKFTIKDGLKAVLLFVVSITITIIIQIVRMSLGSEGASAPSQSVATEYSRLFPLGVFISTVITAPIWEEIVFRMIGKKLIKNSILFVVISPLLFAFIHTVNFSILDNLSYFIYGVYMCAAYLKLKDIRILMVAHLLENLTGIMISLLAGA